MTNRNLSNVSIYVPRICSVWAPQDTLKKSIGHEVMFKFERKGTHRHPPISVPY